MEKRIKEVLSTIEDCGFEAYVIGGYVRDFVLGKESSDIDICTNATPKDIVAIFQNIKLPKEEYGSVTVIYKGLRCEITTYRKDICYLDNRRPETVVYINDLKEDLQRRDFTMNTLCMNRDGKIIDLLNGKQDIVDRRIKTVGDPFVKFEEDALRILRTIRFATILDFDIDEQTQKAIKKKRHLLFNLSYYRKKEELDKIFSSVHIEKGIKLLLKFKLDKYLELPNLKKIKKVDDIIGIWSQIYNEKYPFSKVEKQTIKEINDAMKKDILDPYELYLRGSYILSIVATMKGIPKKEVLEKYNELPIKKQKDINITSAEICDVLQREQGSFLKTIYQDLEKEIVYGNLANDNDQIKLFLTKLSYV